MPAVPRIWTWGIVVVALLEMQACSPTGPVAAPGAGPVGGSSMTQGVIVSLRANPAQWGGDIRGAILGAIGGGVASDALARDGGATEFIVRQDDGQTISVVQTNTDNFHPGDRVVLTRSPSTHVARAAPGS